MFKFLKGVEFRMASETLRIMIEACKERKKLLEEDMEILSKLLWMEKSASIGG